ncbi:MAG: phenylalanine--tRNA ligase subunit beta [Patescibacteria group bacterium]|jgi:phenylalanyl-tRNA synthetase beta chain
MKISLNCLKEFVNLSNINPEDIKDKLTAHVVEVEQIIKQADQFENIVVAKIIEIKKHPQADRLQIALVDDGEENLRPIVCGAPNIAVGQLVPLAKIGAKLSNGLEIQEAEIRGEKSYGMLCSIKELGLGDNHDGIMILDKRAKIGQNLAEFLKLDEIVLEIDNKSISNRPDLWGHYGIARELSVLFEKKLKEHPAKNFKIKKGKDSKLEIEIKNKNLCKKYIALKIDQIKVEESPNWLKNKLQALGLNPINNIVDAANYVMLETGQPLHIFDAKGIDKIIVKKAEKNEKFVTLMGEEKILNENDIVISDEKQSIALAGVIGGKEKEVNNTTTSIIIESANFDAISIRKTAQRLNCRTDAAMRFEKSLDPQLCQLALNRIVELLKTMQKNIVISSEILETGDWKEELIIIDLNLDWLKKIIGEEIKEKTIKSILESLGLKVKEKTNKDWEVKIPSWRQEDLRIKEDLLEEIIRIYGYNNIPASLPDDKLEPPIKDPLLELIKKVKNILSRSYKMTEIYNYSFLGQEQLTKLNIDTNNHLRLLNPSSSHFEFLRTDLIAGLVSNIQSNQAKKENLSFFEIGNIFLNVAGEIPKDKKQNESLPYQEKKLGLALANYQGDSFSNLKSIITSFLNEIQNNLNLEFLPSDLEIPWAKKDENALIMLNNREIGFIAKLSPEAIKKNSLKKDVSLAEISLKNLLNILNETPKAEYQAPAKFPSLKRDLAFVIDQKILYNDINREIKNFSPLLKELELFDVYNLEENKKSLAFHLSYASEEKTLSTEEVDKIQAELIKHLENKFSAQIRDF